MPSFTLQASDGNARAGVIRTAQGDVPTPVFIPVATQAAVKSLDPVDLRSIGASVVLANTYHLYLRPGPEIIESLGGIHRFMGWDGTVLTDSGGFQGFSLEHLREITEDAIIFKSHIDGTSHTFTPEAAIGHQERMGADIVMPLDLCLPYDSDRPAVDQASEQTSRWAARSREAHRSDQMLFGIVQGGVFQDLRRKSAEFMTSLDFLGYAVGGLSVGESKEEMYATVQFTAGLLPETAPRYLMGAGSPEDLVECVGRGIDMFDCVLPTRIARNGALLGQAGTCERRHGPLPEPGRAHRGGVRLLRLPTFSAAYLHHLFRAKELLAHRLAMIHNLRFLLRLMEEMRAAIEAGTFSSYQEEFLREFVPPDERTRRVQKQRWLAAQGRLRER